MYLTKTPSFVQSLFPSITWKVQTKQPRLYLTFDDGPVPEVTEWVLDLLAYHDAKATFFCVGENVKKYPHIFERITLEGHTIGNHTYHHKNGWKTSTSNYIQDVEKCAKLVKSNLFRPPYGRISPWQLNQLKEKFELVMWDILSGDFDHNLDPESCFRNVINNSGPGSILVFHDSVKASKKLKYVLPKVLEHFTNLGFSFEALSKSKVHNSVS